MARFDDHLAFCSNPECRLYVRMGDAGVMGSGNWAQFADGRIVGRGIYAGLYLCDPCGREWRPVAWVTGRIGPTEALLGELA